MFARELSPHGLLGRGTAEERAKVKREVVLEGLREMMMRHHMCLYEEQPRGSRKVGAIVE